jgi:hypothetical protein
MFAKLAIAGLDPAIDCKRIDPRIKPAGDGMEPTNGRERTPWSL